jgi:hypothetical protein
VNEKRKAALVAGVAALVLLVSLVWLASRPEVLSTVSPQIPPGLPTSLAYQVLV